MPQQNNVISKYGEYSKNQIASVKLYIRKSIFFLLLYVDSNTKEIYQGVDVENAFQSLQLKLNGLNKILLEPPELVIVMSLLESALSEYKKNDFNFKVYRKLILDAGSEIMKICEIPENLESCD